MLITKKKENFWNLMRECKEITLDSNFREIKKLIKEDPRFVILFCNQAKTILTYFWSSLRYSKYSSSDRKCEKQFNEFLKDLMSKAKSDFRELLLETKKISHESMALVKADSTGAGHMTEITELLAKVREIPFRN